MRELVAVRGGSAAVAAALDAALAGDGPALTTSSPLET